MKILKNIVNLFSSSQSSNGEDTYDNPGISSLKELLTIDGVLDRSDIIYFLRKNGIKVRVLHWRATLDSFGSTILFPIGIISKGNFSAKGGKTEVFVSFSDGTHYHGESLCSLKDNFNRKKGITMALKRALEVEPSRNPHRHQVYELEDQSILATS